MHITAARNSFYQAEELGSCLQDGANLEAGTSNVSDLSTAARTTTDFSLDDLLGLGPDTCDGTETAPERPTSDPFQVASSQPEFCLYIIYLLLCDL